MRSGTRAELLGLLAQAVTTVDVAHPARIAVDGPPASGKTTIADELAALLRARGRFVVRASIDDFLLPRTQRYRRGEYSGEGCYFDAHDHDTVKRWLLDPLGPGGHRQIRHVARDRVTDAALRPAPTTCPDDAVLIFDGVFLIRPELISCWELRVLVLAAPETTLSRAVVREQLVSPQAAVERRWRQRYIPAQELYFATVHPADHADIVVHNDEPQQPSWRLPAA